MIKVILLSHSPITNIAFISIDHNMTLNSCKKNLENHCIPKKILNFLPVV